MQNSTKSGRQHELGSNATHSAKIVSQLVCFNCLRLECGFSRCRIQKHKDWIRKDFDIWEQSHKFFGPPRANAVNQRDVCLRQENFTEMIVAEINRSTNDSAGSHHHSQPISFAVGNEDSINNVEYEFDAEQFQDETAQDK